jgi:hypothetical protein
LAIYGSLFTFTLLELLTVQLNKYCTIFWDNYRSVFGSCLVPVTFVVFNDSTEQRIPEIVKTIEVVK